MKTWLITGTSTGLGRALAEALIAAGHNVVATARDKRKLDELVAMAPDRVLAVSLEITRQKEIDATVSASLEKFGRIDVLVNNAGYGLVGAIEEVSDAEARHQFDVNVFGLLAMTRAVLPQMRAQGSGHILNISSQGGVVATPGIGIYAATKFAVEAISESLAAEVAPHGIKVTSIQPGPFRTQWAGDNMLRVEKVMEEYAASSGALSRMFRGYTGKQPGNPALAAQAMMQLVEEATPPVRLPLGKAAYARIRGKLDLVSKELSDWESLGLPTDFPQDA